MPITAPDLPACLPPDAELDQLRRDIARLKAREAALTALLRPPPPGGGPRPGWPMQRIGGLHQA